MTKQQWINKFLAGEVILYSRMGTGKDILPAWVLAGKKCTHCEEPVLRKDDKKCYRCKQIAEEKRVARWF